MSWEAWGTPPDPEPNPCELCGEELGSVAGCKLCEESTRADKAELELYRLKATLAHRLRILRSRKVYEDGKKENGVSVEFLTAITLLSGIPGVLEPHEVAPRVLAEAEQALLTYENARYRYSVQPGCNCLHDNKPHPAVHAGTCPYRARYGAAYGLRES
jgi:hypothetical protein